LSAGPSKQRALLRAALALGLVTAALVAAGSARSDSPIQEKQAEARQVLARIDALGHALDRATEAYDGATYHLRRIREGLRVVGVQLRVARHNYRVAEDQLAARLRGIYMSGPTDSTLEVILGARSLDEVITALETQNQLAHQDTELVREVTTFRAAVTRRDALLRRAKGIEERIVAERAAARARIASGLAEQHRLLGSSKNEIATLVHQQAVEEAQLAAEAQARLAEQRAASQAALNSVVVGATAESPNGAGGSATVLPPSAIGSRVVAIAEQYLGRPYVWGAAGPYAFDCSGLVMYVFDQVGISLPHYAAAQWNYGTYVPKDLLEPGDLVFFDDLGHVGIYVGGGDYIQAPQPGDVVKITPLSDPWSEANYYGAKRIVG
jgi:peptidoglycan DL-endopeptidase CwlO